MTSEGNGRKKTQNDKIIINTISMKPDFPIIKKLYENCNVNVPLESVFCRNNTPVDPILSLKCWSNFNLILDGCIPFKLLVIKLRLMFGNMRY